MSIIPPSFTLQTERFRLRIPSADDFPHIFSATRFPGFNDGMLWEPPAHMDELRAPLERNHQAWRDGTGYGFTVEEKESRRFLGRISIRPTDHPAVWNVGFWTHPAFQRLGIMTEALAAILSFGFNTLMAQRIEADYATWNKASEKVLARNGLQFVGYKEKGYQKKGKWVAENSVAIDKVDWLARSNP